MNIFAVTIGALLLADADPKKDAGLSFYPPAKVLIVNRKKDAELSFYPPAKALVVRIKSKGPGN